jgi:hypothetical protein
VAELSAKILLAIATGVAKQGAGVLPASVTDTIGATLGITGELGKAAAEGGAKILKEGTDAGKGILKGVGDLLKSKEDK